MKNLFLTLMLFFSTFMVLGQQPPELEATSAVLMDFQTGRILFEKNSDMPFPPASMTKVITLYLTYQAIEQGLLNKTDVVEITKVGSSFSRPPRSSIMMLEEGQRVDLLTVMQGVAVSSGNDAAYQLSELVSGDPESFVMDMNQLMADLGLEHMHFVDPDGWSELNQVTAREYAEFSSIYIRKFPQALQELHSLESLEYPQPENFASEDAKIRWTRKKRNTNSLLDEVEGVDGLKTGYIDESGFNFTATAKRGDTRFIAVIMGVFTDYYNQGLVLRAKNAEELLEYGFTNWKTFQPEGYDKSLKIWMGEQDQVKLEMEEPPWFTLSREEQKRVVVIENVEPFIKAPLSRGISLGEIYWYLDGNEIGHSQLVSGEEVRKENLIHRVIDFFPMIIYKLSHGRQ